ncbi:unnamed protein product [Cuscuta epithymum]|uniref:Uncharacterized protein n=1 Tax=Cuscuta epithymum TaxID=186058 RepID=A0AAV0EPR5_9ASTE|nr:unnamed protein product [Cuscuta epithymum]
MVNEWLGMPRLMGTLASSVKWIKKERSGANVQAKASRIALYFSIYWIWRVRNAATFDGVTPKEDDVFARIKYIVYKVLYSIYPYDRFGCILINFLPIAYFSCDWL